jgi:hypothetical protein
LYFEFQFEYLAFMFIVIFGYLLTTSLYFSLNLPKDTITYDNDTILDDTENQEKKQI